MNLFEKVSIYEAKKGILWKTGGKVTYFNYVEIEVICRCHSDKWLGQENNLKFYFKFHGPDTK